MAGQPISISALCSGKRSRPGPARFSPRSMAWRAPMAGRNRRSSPSRPSGAPPIWSSPAHERLPQPYRRPGDGPGRRGAFRRTAALCLSAGPGRDRRRGRGAAALGAEPAARRARPQGLAQAPDAGAAGCGARRERDAPPLRRPRPCCDGRPMPAPAPKDAAARDDRNAREAPEEIDAGRPLRRPADSPIGAIPDPIVPAAAHSAEEAPRRMTRHRRPCGASSRCSPRSRDRTVRPSFKGASAPQAPPGGRPSRKPPRSMSASGASRSRRCMKRRRRRSGRRPAANAP